METTLDISSDGLLTIPQIGTLLDALNVEYANNRMCRWWTSAKNTTSGSS